MFNLPEKIEYVLRHITDNGYEAFIVGGCVRDMLMGKVPHDFDITTSATPDEIQKIFEKTVPTGIKHGTVTVIAEGESIEVTTFRSDGDYTDCRHPERVEFVRNIEADLSRRDFTVNAIAYNADKGIIDLFGGTDDINKKILKTVGQAEKRFSEDALRIMRLFRFASVLGFEIEEKTLKAALRKSSLLKTVSAERVNTELTKLLCGKQPEVIRALTDCGGLSFLGINKASSLEKLKMLPENQGIRFFAFLKQSDAVPEDFLTKIKASNQLKSEVFTLIKISNMSLKGKTDIKELLNIAGLSLTEQYLGYLNAFCDIDISVPKSMLNEIIERKEPYKISHLAIGGNDLLSLGIKGEDIGKALEDLRRYVLESPECNTREELLKNRN